MIYKTIENALRASKKSGLALYYPELGEKIVTRMYKGRYFILYCNYFDTPEWRVREVARGGGSWSADFCGHRSFADALWSLRWIIGDDAHKAAGTGSYAGLGRKARKLAREVRK